MDGMLRSPVEKLRLPESWAVSQGNPCPTPEQGGAPGLYPAVPGALGACGQREMECMERSTGTDRQTDTYHV